MHRQYQKEYGTDNTAGIMEQESFGNTLQHSRDGSESLKIDESPEISKGPAEACLFVANLPHQFADEELRDRLEEMFKRFGQIGSVKASRDSRGRPYGFVQFSRVEDAYEASIHGSSLSMHGRRLRIEKARCVRTLYIQYIQLDYPFENLKIACDEYGATEIIKLFRMREPSERYQAAVVLYEHRSDAVMAYRALRQSFPEWVICWVANNCATDIKKLAEAKIPYVAPPIPQPPRRVSFHATTPAYDAYNADGFVSPYQTPRRRHVSFPATSGPFPYPMHEQSPCYSPYSIMSPSYYYNNPSHVSTLSTPSSSGGDQESMDHETLATTPQSCPAMPPFYYAYPTPHGPGPMVMSPTFMAMPGPMYQASTSFDDTQGLAATPTKQGDAGLSVEGLYLEQDGTDSVGNLTERFQAIHLQQPASFNGSGNIYDHPDMPKAPPTSPDTTGAKQVPLYVTPDRTVFVGGLNPRRASVDLIKDRLEGYGKIDRITLVNKNTNEVPRDAYAFVTFSTSKKCQECIEKEDGKVWDGQIARLAVADASKSGVVSSDLSSVYIAEMD